MESDEILACENDLSDVGTSTGSASTATEVDQWFVA